MTKRFLALLFALCLLLSGCNDGSGSNRSGGALIYRVSTADGGAKLRTETIELKGEVLSIDKIVECLNSPPLDINLARAFPEGVEIKSVNLREGSARVYMSAGYMLISDVERLLVNGAIVLSLSVLDQVSYVEIVCGSHWSSGPLVMEEFLVADSLCGEYERSMKFYVPNAASTALRPRSITVEERGELPYIQMLLLELFRALGGGMGNTRVLTLGVEDGVCRVDLSQEFYGAEPADGNAGMLLIYSIVNSLCRVPGVDGVVLSVEGAAVESFGGYATAWPLEADPNLVKH